MKGSENVFTLDKHLRCGLRLEAKMAALVNIDDCFSICCCSNSSCSDKEKAGKENHAVHPSQKESKM